MLAGFATAIHHLPHQLLAVLTTGLARLHELFDELLGLFLRCLGEQHAGVEQSLEEGRCRHAQSVLT